jgi:hypothetical protein
LTGSSTRILKYVEDLKRGTNTEVGPKDYFEIASIIDYLWISEYLSISTSKYHYDSI